MPYVLQITNLCKEYTRRSVPFKAVNNVSLSINTGDFINIIGRSGSGKSTLLNMTAGMLTPTSGSIELDGENFSGKNDSELSKIRNEKIGFIPQGASALPNFTVIENILLPFYLWAHGGDGEGFAYILLERLGISHLANSYPSELSGVELRRVLIARALINNPKIIIADEPTSDLDIDSTKNIMEIFVNLNKEGITFLIVSHDFATLKYGNRIYTMNDGVLTKGNAFIVKALEKT